MANSVHPQMINPNDYNAMFKNYLRDFYTYGFKSNKDFRKKFSNKNDADKVEPSNTYTGNKTRLENILSIETGVVWKKQKARVNCCTADSRRLVNNPFQNIYDFSLNSNQWTVFALLFSLSPKITKKRLQLNTNDENFVINKLKEMSMSLMLGEASSFDDIIKRSDCSQIVSEAFEAINDQVAMIGSHINIYHKLLADKKIKPTKFKDIEKYVEEYGVSESIKELRELYDESAFFSSEEEYNLWINTVYKIETVGKEINFKDVTIDYSYKSNYYNIKQIIEILHVTNLKKIVYIELDQLQNILDKLNEIGIIDKKEHKGKYWYSLSTVYINDIIPIKAQKRFIQMIKFFKNTEVLGTIGHHIEKRFEKHSGRKQKNEGIYQKHHYIKNAINDYNNIVLLNAIKDKTWIRIQYRNAIDLKPQEIICYPLNLKESVVNGRQFLIYYHPVFRSVSALRVEFIDTIQFVECEFENIDIIENDIANSNKLCDYSFGTGFDDFASGNTKSIEHKHLELELLLNKDEYFVVNRVLREKQHGNIDIIDENDETLKIIYTIQITSLTDIIPWVRSYIKRIISIRVDGVDYLDVFSDVEVLLKAYTENNITFNPISNVPNDKSTLKDDLEYTITKSSLLNTQLFNEIFNHYYFQIGALIVDIINGTKSVQNIEKTIDSIIKFGKDTKKDTGTLVELRKDLYDYLNGLVSTIVSKKDNNSFSFGIEPKQTYGSLIPLTLIEIQWLRNILEHPKAKLFLDVKEINHIREHLPVLNIFDISEYEYYDQYTDMRTVYAKKDYIDHFRSVISAVNNSKLVCMSYSAPAGKSFSGVYALQHIEYSKRDDKFRVNAVDENENVFTLNLERICSIEVLDSVFDSKKISNLISKSYEENKKNIVIKFTDRKNVPDRILSEFSPWKKECTKDTNANIYTLNLEYDKNDTFEIVVRLLSYGPYILIVSDDGEVKRELVGRLREQAELIKIRGLNRTSQGGYEHDE